VVSNNAQELTPKTFEIKFDKNRKRKYFLSMPRFKPGSERRMKDANSAMPPL
jgi:hypothetical protein